MPTFDSPWKDVLYHHLRLFLLLLYPRLEQTINWKKDHEPLEQELRRIVPESEVGVRVADAMIKVWLNTGDERILHAEVQAQKQDDFGRRVFGYNYRGYDRFGSHPESLVILGDDDPAWRPTSYEVKLEYTSMTFTFEPVKLLDFAARREELMASENPMGLFVLAHLDAQRTAGDLEAAEAAKLALLTNLAMRKLDAEEKLLWVRYLDYFFSDLPAEVSGRIDRQVAQLDQEQDMSFAKYVTTTERRGKREGLLAGLETSIRIKFPHEADALIASARRIDDPDQLAVLLTALEKASKPDDLRPLLTAPPAAASGTEAK